MKYTSEFEYPYSTLAACEECGVAVFVEELLEEHPNLLCLHHWTTVETPTTWMTV